jgi:hypothetical protein
MIDSSVSLRDLTRNEAVSMKSFRCDILVAGGGTGGTAAALRAAAMGQSVIVTEESRWLGGQLTAQGVSALDEHRYIEEFGGTATYYRFREGVREYYRRHYRLKADWPNLNPGNGWVSRLCYEPKVGVAVIEEMLRPHVEAGRLRVLYETVPVSVERDGDRITAVIVADRRSGEQIRIEAAVVIDSTELGDLLPLAGVPYRSGRESFAETGEPSAPPEGSSEIVQSFTYTFAVEYRPGESHVIPKPEGYELFRDRQPFGLNGYRVFAPGGPIGLPFWTYRRLIDASQFEPADFPNDIAMINWPSNDYHGANLIDKPQAEQERIRDEAKRLSLSFLYWLQTEAPRDDGGHGYPELKLRPDVMGTDDGLSQVPYIRESRRLQAFETVREQDIVTAYNPGSRARLHPDSVGLGLYIFVDVHRCCNSDTTPGNLQQMRPFQIPLGALLTPAVTNLVAGAKNLGVTHITNGAFRLHPTEWNVGESAGAVAAFALQQEVSPAEVYRQKELLRRFQGALAAQGVPLYWFIDLPYGHPAFAAVQTLAAAGVITGDATDLLFRPDEPLAAETAKEWADRAGKGLAPEPGESRAAFALRLAGA